MMAYMRGMLHLLPIAECIILEIMLTHELAASM